LKVVSNTSPLIILYKCDKLYLLENYLRCDYSPKVHDELILNTKDPKQREVISKCAFISIRKAPKKIPSFGHKIDRGEAEAIALASALKADFLLVDDRRAQRAARLLNITYISTFAILLKVFQKGFINNFDELIQQLEEQMIFLNRDLKNSIPGFLKLP